jgi:3-mercaptopyruvate sulfurtransferase SseA
MRRRRPGTVVLVCAVVVTGLLAGRGLYAASSGQAPEDARRITLADFKKLYDEGRVVVLDVRAAQTYREGHIAGAISAPLDTVVGRAGEWRGTDKVVVTYCS